MTDRTEKLGKASASGVTRRGVLKTGAAATAAGGLGISTFSFFTRTAQAAGKLRVLCWPGYEEKDVVEEFEDTNKVKVEFKIYIGGEQMLQFFAQTPRGTFDAIVADAEYVTKLKAANALEQFSIADFPEMKNYHPDFADFAPVRGDGGKVFGVATRFSFYGISYNKSIMSPEEADDWNSLFLPKFKGKVGIFDWYLPNMGNASLAVSPKIPNPYDIPNAKLAEVGAWLKKLRPQVAMFGSSSQAVVQAMITGDVQVAPVGDLDIDMTMAGYDNYTSNIPKQGGVRWQEVACVCAQSGNKDLAREWAKYMTLPKIQSRLVYTKAFKARAPNMKVTDYWDADQKKLLSYVPDPANPSKMLVESLISRSMARSLPIQQPDQAWIDVFNGFKTS